ncbi:MAG: PAS domain S-box protein [Candidatus Omnitrophica bacterium]|nr:PAS domain S-box protein [Candidatus Omnitrophota bacterium]
MKRNKVCIAILFGYLGFIVNFFPVNFDFTPYRASFFFGLIFPLLISQAWGWRYGLLSATLGLGAQTMWFHWFTRSGWGSLVSIPPFTLWVVWHGWAFAQYKKFKLKRWNPYLIEIPFRLFNIVLLYTAFRWACSFNPPPWAPEMGTTGVPLEYVHFIVVKEIINAYIMLLMADVLINLRRVRLFLRLDSEFWENRTVFVISASLLIGFSFWFIDSIIDHIFFLKKGSPFTDVLLFNVSVYELYFRFSFIFGCLISGFIISRMLAKQYQSEIARIRSEERLSVALKVTDEAIWDWNITTGETFFSDRYFTMLGYEPGELPSTYETWANLLHPDDREVAQADVWQHIKDNKDFFELEFQLKTNNGGWCWVLARGNVISRDAQGQPTRMIGTHINITERKNMENALRKSEAQHRITINSIDHAIHVIDRDFRIVLCNRTIVKWNKSLGFSTHLVGTHLFTIYPFLKDQIREEYETVFETGKPIITEEKNLIEGHDIYTETRKIPIFEQDQVTQVLTIIHNITDRKVSEQTLRESEERLAVTLDSIGDCVIVANTDSTIKSMNPVAERLTGWMLAEAEGKVLSAILELRDPATHAAIQDPVSSIVREGKIMEISDKLILITRTGEERIISDSGAPIRDKDGNIIGVVIVFRDMTKQVQVEEQLRHAQKMKAIGQLAGGIAHDFNNLLTGISNFAELLKPYAADNEKMKQFVDGILTTTSRATSLTTKLLTFARKGKFQIVQTNVHALIDDVIEIFKHSIDKKIVINKHLNAEQPVTTGDPAQLQNAILNIALNARDAMLHGGTITFSTANREFTDADIESKSFSAPPGKYIEVAISDTGIGIESHIRDHIFEPFFTTKPVGKGIGMGLAAVYGTIEDHNGIIRVDTVPERGTTFTLFLPVTPVENGEELPADPSTVITGTGTILFVDDDVAVRKSTKEMLMNLGYTTEVCADGEEAVEYYRKHAASIDLVLLDMIMPKMDGWEVFYALKKINPAVKVLFATGYTISDTTEDLVRGGALGVIQKPFKLHDLSNSIAQALSARNCS